MNKKDPIFKWHEKLLMYFVALVVIAFLIIIGNIREQNEIEDKIQSIIDSEPTTADPYNKGDDIEYKYESKK